MKNPLMNPFKFGDPVGGEYYLPRAQLTQLVTQFLENRIHVVLIGPRRFGKTSFVLNILEKFESRSYSCFFVDIFNITSHKDFLQQMIRALKVKKSCLHDVVKDLFANFRPKMSTEFDLQTGQPSFGLMIDNSSEKDVKEMIQDMLTSLDKFGDQIILVIDEFQKIAEIDDQGWLEATLRTHMQQLRNVSFLFTGSRKSIIYDMLNNNSRPLYRFCQPIEFPSLGKEFTGWIVNKFSAIGIECQSNAIQHLRNLVHDTPNYVQMICFHLVAEGKKRIFSKEVENTLETVVRQNAYAYQMLLNSLTPMQRRVLRLAAAEGKQVYAKEFLKKYEITSSAALAASIKSLKEKGILDEEASGKGNVIFDDPLFAIWLKLSMDR